jgi:uncharacterized protein
MGWMLTYTGLEIDPMGDVPEFRIKDIAHSLSMICRFNGHTKEFYSVAEHSIRVVNYLDREFQFAGLMHDAHEAYTGDMIRPIKENMGEFSDFEDEFAEDLAGVFGLPWPLHKSVKLIDLRILKTELRDVMNSDAGWKLCLPNIKPFRNPIIPRYSQRQAEEEFLRLYEVLKADNSG